jgi:predicted N-formylglutamate amidohydrolase
MKRFCVITCEHGGNRLPDRFRPLFAGHWAELHSHEGWDRGALRLAREMAAALGGEHHYSVVSRLLVDLNRSIGAPDNLSDVTVTSSLDSSLLDEIFEQYYHPYRRAVERSVAAAIDRGERVLHLSCHSFAEEVDGEVRQAPLGILYDPVRVTETRIAHAWQERLGETLPDSEVRFNYPYLGTDDGLVTTLRGCYPDPLYAGIELEVRRDVIARAGVRGALVAALAAGLAV